MHQSYARCLHVATPSSSYVVVVTFLLISIANSFWATVCKMVCPMLSDRCPVCPVLYVCLSVTLVYCGQMVGWIKIPFGTEVNIGPVHVVLDGVPAALPKKGAQPPVFGPCLLWPNGWMDEDVTWYGSRPRPRPHCVRRGPSFPRERGTAKPVVVTCRLEFC